MRALHTGSASHDLDGFVRDAQKALRVITEERYSDNIPGGRYYACAVPGIRVVICEDLDPENPNALAPDRFMVFVDLEVDLAPKMATELETRILTTIEQSMSQMGYRFIVRDYG